MAMSGNGNIRRATADDAAACAAIYAPYVTDTTITFETEPPTAAEMACRIEAANERHAWLVLEVDGEVVGYAYGTEHRTRAAYRWACDASIYLQPGRRRTGAGRALYAALLPILAARGYRRVMGGVTQPNEASMGLHHSFGFTDVGTYHKVGWKLGAWHDVTWLQLDLTPDEDPTAPPAELG
ncbi:GNAT family N-acetyltransferase [Catellatospora coxensis]|uniref:N-acetyltransferase n=2 Tax=Catellatospora coxensis TaxID=310354 RepID=A0A8J3KQG7_9ACTN|nr:N-acetyltransferase [Catellatospora coxensis]